MTDTDGHLPVPGSGESKADPSEVVANGPEFIESSAPDGAIVSYEMQQMQSGPLPSPAVLAEYGEVVPGLSDTIVDQWTGETEHRRSMEKESLAIARAAQEGHLVGERRGQLISLAVVLVFAVLVAYAIYARQPWTAASISAIGAIVWAMRRSSSGEKSEDQSERSPEL